MVEFGSGSYQFNTGYASAMDREGDYGHGHSVGSSGSHDGCGHDHGSGKATGDVGMSAGDFGSSFALGPVANMPQILSKIRSGQKKLEIAFFGMGKGSGQGHTAGMYGEKQRQALREAAKANRMDWSLHTSVGVAGLAGKDRSGHFSKEAKVMSIQEIKRAISFAADVAEGGPVVVHTGEFDRPISEANWNQTGKWKDKFEMYADEKKRGSYQIVDTRTGRVIEEARKGKSITKPDWKVFEEGDDIWQRQKGKVYVDEHGNTVKPGDYIDYWGNKLERATRVPKWNKEKNQFEVQQLGWDKLQKEAREMQEEARNFWKKHRNSKDKNWDESLWRRFRNVTSEEDIIVRPEEAYVIATLETNAANSRAWALNYAREFDEDIERLKKLKEAEKIYQKIESSIDEEEKWRLQKKVQVDFHDLVPPETKMPSELIQKQIRNVESRMKQAQDSAAGQWSQARDSIETAGNIESAHSYALKEAYDAYAQAGVYALKQSEQLAKKGKLKRNLMVAMENLFPEAHGAHPEEIIELVQNSRKAMQKKLISQGYSENDAWKKSEDTLTMTLDVGHLNMWRKYWKGDDQKSPDENDKEFDNWMLDMTEKMAKSKVIGHVHLDDNFGYNDTHLAPGEGNAPIKRMVEILKKNGYRGDLIVEPGADYNLDQGGWRSVQKTWDLFGAHIKGTGSGFSGYGGRKWSQIHYGHQGKARPPGFTFGAYSPSEDWTLWTGVPLE